MPDMHLLAQPALFRNEPRRRADWPRRLLHGVVFALSVAVALLSYRYLLDVGPVPPIIAANRFKTFWLILHVGFAATALLVGVLQFGGRLRRRWPDLHRRVGRVYAPACLIGAVSGFVLALGSSAGPIASVGFGGLALVWFHSTALGWQRARTKQFASHGRWMIRSWALTLAAVTLRIYMPLFEMAGLPDLPSYRAISFLCWVPNLLVAELLIRRQATTGTPSRSTSTSSSSMPQPRQAA